MKKLFLIIVLITLGLGVNAQAEVGINQIKCTVKYKVNSESKDTYNIQYELEKVGDKWVIYKDHVELVKVYGLDSAIIFCMNYENNFKQIWVSVVTNNKPKENTKTNPTTP